MKCSLGICNFLEEISSLSHSIVFLYFFPLITEEGFLNSPCYSLELCIQMGVSSFSPLPLLLFFSQIIVRTPQTTILPFCIFFLGDGLTLPPVKCHKLPSIVLQALYQIEILVSISHFQCMIIRDLIKKKKGGFDLGHT